MNRFSGIHNSLSRIMSAQHVNRTSALMRYIDWQRRRLLGLFPIDETISRSQIRVTDSRSGVGALVHTQRMYDYNNMRFLQDVLRWKEGVFFDIGANIGVYAVIASEVAEAEIWAFEPHPRTFAELQGNIARNGRRNVETRRIALWDRDGPLVITDGASSATNHVVENAPSGSIIVEGKRADTLVRERRAPPPRYVKIDVEGFEAKVIHGFGDLIGAVDVWFVEETGLASPRGLSAHAVTDLFLDHGFRGPYRVDFRGRGQRCA